MGCISYNRKDFMSLTNFKVALTDAKEGLLHLSKEELLHFLQTVCLHYHFQLESCFAALGIPPALDF